MHLLPAPTDLPPTDLTLVPVPLYRDADDDRLAQPRDRRVAFAPRPALRDPLAPGSLFSTVFTPERTAA